MKKILFTLVAIFATTVGANAMGFEQARERALFLTDKMAYELNLTDDQYEAVYEVNLDYFLGINDETDVDGVYWTNRNTDLGYILAAWQYRLYCDALYFYRPLYWSAAGWHFRIYARYPQRTFFYFSRPVCYVSYRGDHSWRHNGGSWYRGRTYGVAHRPGGDGKGMKDSYRGGHNPGNNNQGVHNPGGNNRGGFDRGNRPDNNANRDVNRGNRPDNNNVNRGNRSNNNDDMYNRGNRPSSTRRSYDNAGTRRSYDNNGTRYNSTRDNSTMRNSSSSVSNRPMERSSNSQSVGSYGNSSRSNSGSYGNSSRSSSGSYNSGSRSGGMSSGSHSGMGGGSRSGGMGGGSHGGGSRGGGRR